jgi:hypothetical protein
MEVLYILTRRLFWVFHITERIYFGLPGPTTSSAAQVWPFTMFVSHAPSTTRSNINLCVLFFFTLDPSFLSIQRPSKTEIYLQSTPFVLVALFTKPSLRLSALNVILANEQECKDMLRIGRWHSYGFLFVLRLRPLRPRYVLPKHGFSVF